MSSSRMLFNDGKFTYHHDSGASIGVVWGYRRSVLDFRTLNHWNRDWRLVEIDRSSITSYVNANATTQISISAAESNGIEKFAVIRSAPLLRRDPASPITHRNELRSFKADHIDARLDFNKEAIRVARAEIARCNDATYRDRMGAYVEFLRSKIDFFTRK
ncbi:MAG: hypothetical protein KGH58_03355 [Candidatus Micrarchaeota archaeon]|nr:hypothetical protein [Candidatus Micrarchaeota archaeon]